jgi:hypothetical protein
MKKQNPSHLQLLKSQERRIRHMMIRVLENFEDSFPDIEDTRDGQIYKGNIRNCFNDAIRAQRDELNDYEIEYRPLRLTHDNILSMTRTFLQTVQKIDFTDVPSVRFYAGVDKRSVLEALRAEIGVGVIYEDDGSLILEIAGTDDCANCVLSILDKYRLHDDVLARYRDWRCQVVESYRS